jgi:hypothetical protein
VTFKLNGEFILRTPMRGRINLLSEQCKQQGQDNADDDGGGDREVESELLFLDDDVTGELTDPRDLLTDQEKDADGDDKDTQENEHFS